MSEPQAATANQLVPVNPAGVPAEYDYVTDAGAGFEDANPGDFKPSFLKILEKLSPECETVPGAKPGLIIDSITHELFEKVLIVPAVHEHVYVAWRPRNAGGGAGQGFGGLYRENDPIVLEALKKHGDKFTRGADGKLILPKHPDGVHELHETIYFHGIQVAAEGAALYPVCLPFASTRLTVGGSWFTTMRRQVVPETGKPMALFSHAFLLGTAPKARGTQGWHVWTFTWANGTAKASRLASNHNAFTAAKAVHAKFRAGHADVDYAAGGQTEAPGGGTAGKLADEDIPF